MSSVDDVLTYLFSPHSPRSEFVTSVYKVLARRRTVKVQTVDLKLKEKDALSFVE